MPVGIVQKASAHAHWYVKVRTGDSVLIPTPVYYTTVGVAEIWGGAMYSIHSKYPFTLL